MSDFKHLQKAVQTISFLQAHGINPILYGSYGVSIYLGNFKDFSDVDLLVPDRWLQDDWPRLKKLLEENGFELIDLREHEFQKGSDNTVAFASENVLVRDGIVPTLNTVRSLTVDGVKLRTLSPEDFIAAYRYSAKDGYRKEKRGKKDHLIIEKLSDYIDAQKKG